MKALHDICEFGSNIDKELYDPDFITKDCVYYDEIGEFKI
jgi:hypothetical protein